VTILAYVFGSWLALNALPFTVLVCATRNRPDPATCQLCGRAFETRDELWEHSAQGIHPEPGEAAKEFGKRSRVRRVGVGLRASR